ncbi:related to DNA primase large subunit [Saccharomycodes ludwigii]|uniref:DNA primase large subunit n=1 Tax=Saccharomycodes ludwigii TaxID=36035 RepID=A0A376B1I6_9ASCO|nr:related to DNA primase large subunit [Saccharomycodes ludwigii]
MFRLATKRKLINRKNLESPFSGANVDDNFPTEDGPIINIYSTGLTPKQETEIYNNLYDTSTNTFLTIYDQPPRGEITLDQFEIWAIERLKLLMELESLTQRNKSLKEIEAIIKPMLDKMYPISSGTPLTFQRKKDYYSHFILRLCFCRSKELRAKFIRNETLLFNLRYEMLPLSEQVSFIEKLRKTRLFNQSGTAANMFKFITDEEKQNFSNELFNSIAASLQFDLNLTDNNSKRLYFERVKFIKLPFENVIELVGRHQVFINKGYAYLPQFQQLKYISNRYGEYLNEELLLTYRNLPRMNEDDRLIPIIKHLSSGYTISDYNAGFDVDNGKDTTCITSDMILNDAKLWEAYPLCARNLLDGLRSNHHLRYQGRQQLSLFLKGIGLNIDEALKFWSKEFSKSMGVDKFEKEYKYNFKHNYGLEGNRINYRPWDCSTILSKPRPNKGEFHGCPFRDWSKDRLVMELKKNVSNNNITNHEINSILDSCKNHEYTIACTKYYEINKKAIVHGDSSGISSSSMEGEHITHPNLYFERIRMLQTQEKKG